MPRHTSNTSPSHQDCVQRTPPHHDTLTCYTEYQCRLPACVERYNAWCRNRDRAIAAGTWQPLEDAEPVRQHLLQLHAAGITIHRVAVLTGMRGRDVRMLTQHDYGHAAPRKRRVTQEVARRILAINLHDHTPSFVDPTGSRRRVEALAALGWPSAQAALAAGMSPTNWTKTFARPRLLASTAAAYSTAYQLLRGQRPEDCGVRPSSITCARNQAAEHRWPPPEYWDEVGAIDDPHFHPDYGKTRIEILAEDASWLMGVGSLDRQGAADRLRVDRSYVDRAIVAHPELALEVGS